MKKEDKQTSEKINENAGKSDSKEVKIPEAKEKPKDAQHIAELTESLQRLQAEFENYKKRVEKEKQEFVKYANAGLMSKILSTIDTFEIALRNSNEHEKFVKGMEMIYAQLISTLESEGLKPINAVGKKFDPYLHEVMLKQKSDKEEGIVLEELQKGYILNDKVLRYSKVKISEKADQEQNKK
ncbi:MAG: nucleotide exchange factor GrpE [Nanoarchaeota archaeon]